MRSPGAVTVKVPGTVIVRGSIGSLKVAVIF